MSPEQRRLELGVFVGATLVFLVLGLAAPLHHDSLVDLLLARDCRAGIRCVGHRSSFRHLVQGAVWTRAVAGIWGPERSFTAIELVVAAGQGLGAAWVARLGYAMVQSPSHQIRLGAGIGAGTLAVLLTFPLTGLPVIWNPSLSPTAVTCAYLGVAGMDRSKEDGRRLAFCLVASVGAALAVQTHIVAVPVVLVVVFAAAVKGKAYWPIVVLAVVVVVAAAGSEADFQENAHHLREQGLAGFLAWGCFAAVGAGFVVRATGWAEVEGRLTLAAFMVAIAATLAMLAVVAAGGKEISGRYLLCLLPVMSIGPVLAVAWGWPRLEVAGVRRPAAAVGVALGVVIAAWVTGPRIRWRFAPDEDLVHPALSMDEARAISKHLEGRGFGAGDLLRRLQGPMRSELTIAAAAWSPGRGYRPQISPSLRTVPRVVVLSAAPRGWGTAWDRVALRAGRVAMISLVDSRLSLADASWCWGGAHPECVALSPQEWRTVAGGDSDYGRLSDLRLESLRKGSDDNAVAELRIPVHEGPSRRVDVIEAEYRGWSVVLPDGGMSRTIELDRSTRTLILRLAPGKQWPAGQLPALLETKAEEAELQRMLDLVQAAEADNSGDG